MGRSAFLKIAVAAILIFIVFSVVTGGEDPDLSPRLESEMFGRELRLADPISAGAHATINGDDYLFLVTKYGDDRVEPAHLRIVRFNEDERLEQISLLHTSMSVEAPPSAIAVVDGHVFVGVAGEERERPGLWVVDISDPDEPLEANLVSVEMPIRDLAPLDNDLLVTSGYDNEFLVFDIGDPASPALVGRFSESLSVAPAIVASGRRLFVDHMAGVVITEVTGSAESRTLARVDHPDWIIPAVSPRSGALLTAEERFDDAVPEGNYLDMAVSGDLLALAASDDGMVIVDISDPSEPAQMGRLEVPGRAARVALSEKVAYLLGAEPHEGENLRYTLYAIDVSEPTNPEIVEEVAELVGVPGTQLLITDDDGVYVLFNDTVIRFDHPN